MKAIYPAPARIKKAKRYASSSRRFQWAYYLLLLFITGTVLALNNDLMAPMLFLLIVVLPLLVIGSIFRTYYCIVDEKIIRYTLGGKNELPSLVIAVQSLEKVAFHYRKGRKTGLRLYLSENDRDTVDIYLRDILAFLQDLKTIRPDLQVES